MTLFWNFSIQIDWYVFFFCLFKQILWNQKNHLGFSCTEYNFSQNQISLFGDLVSWGVLIESKVSSGSTFDIVTYYYFYLYKRVFLPTYCLWGNFLRWIQSSILHQTQLRQFDPTFSVSWHGQSALKMEKIAQ